MGNHQQLTTDYDELTSGSARPRSSVIGQVWVYDPDKETAYLQWPDQHLSVHATGKTAWWYPYNASGHTKPIILSHFDEDGHWIINPRDMNN